MKDHKTMWYGCYLVLFTYKRDFVGDRVMSASNGRTGIYKVYKLDNSSLL